MYVEVFPKEILVAFCLFQNGVDLFGEAITSFGGCVGEATAASAYVAVVGALAAVSASDEPEESEQTEPSFIQLFTFVMASVCVEGG